MFHRRQKEILFRGGDKVLLIAHFENFYSHTHLIKFQRSLVVLDGVWNKETVDI